MSKELVVANINVNNWCPIQKTSYKDRCTTIADAIQEYNPSYIAAQEVLNGCLDTFKAAFPGYICICPPGSFGPRTLVSVMLVKYGTFSKIIIKEPPKDLLLRNRINILNICDDNGNTTNIVNIYSVCPNGRTSKHYQRDILADNFRNTVMNVISKENGPTLLLGDFQTDSNDPWMEELNIKGFKEAVKNVPTVSNPCFSIKAIDHIMMNRAFDTEYMLKNFEISNVLSNISDHAVLVLRAIKK